jgi:magnesium chelatase family protein
VLFLDEVPEFSRRVLETLRQPLEQRVVHISRAARAVTFPANVMLVGAMNPCPCGYQGSQQRKCRCPPTSVERYRLRLSGPMRDRFDLGVDLPAVAWSEIRHSAPRESTAAVRARVVEARRRQVDRQACANADLQGAPFQAVCALRYSGAENLLERGVRRLGLSARATTRVLRVARTVADLEGTLHLDARHLAEALQFRLHDSAISAETTVRAG